MTDPDLEARIEALEIRIDELESEVGDLVRKLVNKADLTADERKALKRLQAARARVARQRLKNPAGAHADVKKAEKAYNRSRKKRR